MVSVPDWTRCSLLVSGQLAPLVAPPPDVPQAASPRARTPASAKALAQRMRRLAEPFRKSIVRVLLTQCERYRGDFCLHAPAPGCSGGHLGPCACLHAVYHWRASPPRAPRPPPPPPHTPGART